MIGSSTVKYSYMTLIAVECAHCGTTFQRDDLVARKVASAGRRQFCSRACTSRFWSVSSSLLTTHQCELCGKEFSSRWPAARWCSRGCRDEGRRQGETHQCLTCGKSFYVHLANVRRGYGGNAGRVNAYCSPECLTTEVRRRNRLGKAKGRHDTPEQRERKRGPRPHMRHIETFICQRCSTSFEKNGHELRGGIRFCSTTCWYDHVRDHPEENGQFKGGTNLYYGPNWTRQSRLARERDQHTCQRCGFRREHPRLPVHHIRPRREFDKLDYETANALDNLVTLCRSCHALIELGSVIFPS